MKKSSSSKGMDQFTISNNVLELGRALVVELELESGVDTLGRWMAHHIAELITDAETADPNERSTKSKKCADAIFNLWDRRHRFPDGKRPLEDFEPVFRALKSIDPEDDTPRFFRTQRMEAEKAEQNPETTKWLQLVDSLDYSAKVLIRYCLTQAAQRAINKSKKWIAIAESVGAENDTDFSTIKVFLTESDISKSENDPNREKRKLLEDRIKRLKKFKEMADSLEVELTKQLESLKCANKE